MPENKSNFLQSNAESLVITGLIAVCLVIYAQTTGFDFINIDDHSYVYKNPQVLSGVNLDSIKWALTAFHSSNWHPLTWISHALDVQIFGLNPGSHHATNIIFHIINSLLTFVVFQKFTGDLWKSAVVAFLFAVHPAHVESVAWISERKDVLSTFFWLLTMYAYFNYAGQKARVFSEKDFDDAEIEDQTSQKTRKIFYLLTILFLALGLMAKPMLVTLPFVLLLCNFWSLERLKTFRDLKPLIVEKLPLFALVIASSVITFLAQKSSGAVQTLELIPFQTRAVNAIISYGKYIVMLFYPVNLGVWYPYETSLETSKFVGAIILLVGITIFCVMQFKTRKYLLMGWLWFVGTLVPVIGIVQVGGQSLADRYTYIPYFGLFIMLVWGAEEIFERLKFDKKIVAAIWAIVILIFTFLAFKQVTHWKNSETLYKHTLSFTKNNYFLLDNLCLHYINTQPAEIAEKRCTELLEAVSPSPEAHNTLGLLRAQTGKYDDSIRAFQKAIQIKPDFAVVYVNLSVALSKKGNPEEAEKTIEKALSLNDKTLNREVLANAFNVLGQSYLNKNQNGKAIEFFTKALELQPNFKEAAENLKKTNGEK